MGQTIWRSLGAPSKTPGPFDKLRAGFDQASRDEAASGSTRDDNFDISSSLKVQAVSVHHDGWSLGGFVRKD